MEKVRQFLQHKSVFHFGISSTSPLSSPTFPHFSDRYGNSQMQLGEPDVTCCS